MSVCKSQRVALLVGPGIVSPLQRWVVMVEGQAGGIDISGGTVSMVSVVSHTGGFFTADCPGHSP